MNPLNQLIDLYESKSKCADAVGISRQCLNGWIEKGFIPYKNGLKVEKATKGKIKASAVWRQAAIGKPV